MIINILLIFSFVWVTQFTYAKLSGKRISFTRLAACGLLEIGGSADDCADATGGLAESYVADSDDLDLEGATIDADGHILDIPWLTPSTPYVRFSPDDNDEAFFNQEASRDDNGKLTVVQTASYTFTGLTTAKVMAARAMVSCCALVAVHKLNNGFVFIQGIRTKKNASNVWEVIKPTKKAKATPSILSQTGQESDRVTLELIATDGGYAATIAPATTVNSLVNVN